MRLRGGALQQPPFATNRVTTHLLSPSEIGAPERVAALPEKLRPSELAKAIRSSPGSTIKPWSAIDPARERTALISLRAASGSSPFIRFMRRNDASVLRTALFV